MKITKIETFVCNAVMRNWIFVRIETDQPGLYGIGEATLEWHTRSIVSAIEDINDLLIGEDPLRVEYLWQIMFRQHFWHGNGIVRATAISGIDIALWDIVGKHLGVPCHRLWGGPVRDYIRLYCHLGGGKLQDFYETPVDDSARFAELAKEAVETGYSAFKSMAVPPTKVIEGNAAIKQAEKCVFAMREAVGDEVDIMVDCHARQSPSMGRKFAKALEPFDLYFLEEVCWPENIDGLADIRAQVATPIATGERLTQINQFNQLFEAGGCDVAQPDITHCGGLTAARKIAALAEVHRIGIAPHNPQGPVSTSASLEFGFSQPDYIICETVSNDVPWRNEIVTGSHFVDEKTRCAFPGEKPGLGIDLNFDKISDYPFQQEIPQRVFHDDGSVGDW